MEEVEVEKGVEEEVEEVKEEVEEEVEEEGWRRWSRRGQWWSWSGWHQIKVKR